jgi:hypothetical protein
MGGGLAVAAQVPGEAGAQLAALVKEAFIVGLSRGSLVAAGVVAVGAVLAWRYLPARAHESEGSSVDPRS